MEADVIYPVFAAIFDLFTRRGKNLDLPSLYISIQSDAIGTHFSCIVRAHLRPNYGIMEVICRVR